MYSVLFILVLVFFSLQINLFFKNSICYCALNAVKFRTPLFKFLNTPLIPTFIIHFKSCQVFDATFIFKQVQIQKGPCPGRRRPSAGGPLVGHSARNCFTTHMFATIVCKAKNKVDIHYHCEIISFGHLKFLRHEISCTWINIYYNYIRSSLRSFVLVNILL